MIIVYNWPQDPILIVKAPTLHPVVMTVPCPAAEA